VIRLTIVLAFALTMTLPQAAAVQTKPAVLLLNSTALQAAQTAATSGDPEIQPQLTALRTRADQALTHGPFTVAQKQVPPPSGDSHDYQSLSIYWWPDPATPSGLPYIQRDGVRNTEADDTTRYDATPLTTMVADVENLSLAYYLTGDERYAQHAVNQLRTWFLDPATRMNPNFKYAQLIPGRDTVRGTGIIESRRFTRIVDSVALLAGCACWSSDDQQALKTWFHDLETWLRTSPNGLLESRTTNNHGVWYDVQVLDFALFAGDTDAARQTATAAGDRRVTPQIAPDGSMPRELARTRSLHYSNFNLQAFAELATLSEQVNIDLWHFQTPDGATMQNAANFLIPYLNGTQTWPYDEITQVDAFQETAQTLTRAAVAYPDSTYQQLVTQLAQNQSPVDQLRLTLGCWPD
jgi:hypothetical protein